MHADRRRMSRVIANLVQNADMHGGGVTQVVVEQICQAVRISVTNARPRCVAAAAEAVFERFSPRNVRPSRASTMGTGLGWHWYVTTSAPTMARSVVARTRPAVERGW